MKNLEKVIPLNSSDQNDVIAWYCLEKRQLKQFQQLLQCGMPLKAFMLTSMVLLEYSDDEIKNILKQAPRHEKDVVQWIKNYFNLDDLAGILQHYQKDLPKDYPSDEECVKLKLWKTLAKREKFDLVAQNAPEFLIEKYAYTDDANTALLNVNFEKYAPIAFKNSLTAFLMVPDGWKYLVDKGCAERLFDIYTHLREKKWIYLPDRSEVEDYCIKTNHIEELYNAGRTKVLLKNEKTDVFIENKSFNADFLTQFPDQAKWEELWNCCESNAGRKHLKKMARKNIRVQQCHNFLWNHSNSLEKLFLLSF